MIPGLRLPAHALLSVLVAAVAVVGVALPALIEDSRLLHARRANAHAPGPLIPVPGANHFNILDELQKPDGLLTRAVLDLLR